MRHASLADAARWLPVPDGRDDDEVQEFAQAYDGYALHCPDAAHLHDLMAGVIDFEARQLLDPGVSTELLRAALFTLARDAAHGWSEEDLITSSQAGRAILDELRARHPDGLMSLFTGEDGYGYVPVRYRLNDRLVKNLADTVLFACLQLPRHLDAQELSWLGATSKPELAVRDRLGWLLQDSLHSVAVAREWKRSDLAVLQDGQPRVVIEGKAMYGFDAISAVSRAQYVDKVAADLEKARRVAPGAYVLATVLMTTVMGPWDDNATAAVAYASGNRRTANLGTDGRVEAVATMWDALGGLGQVGLVDLGTGVAFGAEVATDMFLVR